MRSVAPMIHVPDVAATVAWYEALGFELIDANDEGGEVDWAMVAWGEDAVMFNSGGRPANGDRREVDLYVTVENVDSLHQRLKDHVEVVQEPNDTFYGMREFTVRDPNGFWVTFGESLSGEGQAVH